MQSKQRLVFKVILTTIVSYLILATAQAAKPLWTFVPQTPTNITINSAGNAQIIYDVYNQSNRPKTLIMRAIAGVNQTETCNLPANGTCRLTLNVNGAALPNDVIGGPVLCEQGNEMQCYQPSSANILHIHLIKQLTTLSPVTQDLALSINSPGSDPALTGNPRVISIENTGSIPANNLQVSNSGFPTGTSITDNQCTGTLNPGATCDITITPGGTASSDSNADACTTPPGTTPIATTVTVSADNTVSTNINVLILGYGCIYNGGFLFSVDDSTPSITSIAGKVAALADEPSNSIKWATLDDDTAADSITDGLTNTNSLATPAGQYPSAQACLNKIDQGFSDWYLPAICELGRYVGLGVDAGCGATNPNLYSTLYVSNLGGLNAYDYWSSTEFSGDLTRAWVSDNLNGAMNGAPKTNTHAVRCIRDFTP